MIRKSLTLTTAAAIVALSPTVASASTSSTQTLRFFDKPVAMKVTHADGTVDARPPFAEPRPGDVLEVNSLVFRGDHARHAKRSAGSTHLRCVFGTGEPDCQSHVALGGSLLVFTGNPGTLTNGTGIYQGATGRVTSTKEAAGGSDVIARITVRRR